jgi:hypothetical protein
MAMANGSGVEADAARTAAPDAKPGARKRLKGKLIKRQVVQSSIVFPYMDLETAISVAFAIYGAGGVPLSRDQLAGVMKTSAGSGTFLTKTSTARIFGLVAYTQSKFELTNLGFSIVDSDEKRKLAARAESFLTVPLYKRVYDEFKGRPLPPRPHGLEQAFARFGVPSKQTYSARLAFDKSAKQGGFFTASPDRLIEPIIGAVPAADRNRPTADEENDRDSERGRFASESGGPETSGLHPFIQGLLSSLPEPETNWTMEGRAKWLQAAANIFDLMYKGTGNITITAKPEPQSKE